MNSVILMIICISMLMVKSCGMNSGNMNEVMNSIEIRGILCISLM